MSSKDSPRQGGAASRPRMADVAREAGVSLVTVSRAINQPDKVAAETLVQVRSAIERLRYVPNLTAGSLASNRSRIIAAVVPTLASSIFSDTIDGLAQALDEGGYQLLVGQTRYDADHENEVVDIFIGRRVDGLMLIRTGSGRSLDERLAMAGIPLIQTWELADGDDELSVGFSNRAAGAAAGHYLLERGYSRIAFLGSDGGRAATRHAGLIDAMAAAGLPQPAFSQIGPMASLAESAEGFRVLMAEHPDTRAILCANDSIAAGALFECQRRGLDVPGDVAVMGFGDLPIAEAIVPTLTTVRVSSGDMGLRAGELLLARLSGETDSAGRVDLGFTVMARDSA